MFDTLISPLDIANFGQPTDIDKNGKTVIFFTKEVNKLTPRGSGGVIGGFFFERDLFPKTDTPTTCSGARQQLRRDVLLARAGSQRAIQRCPLEEEGPRPHAKYARPRVPAPDQRRTPDVRQHRRRLRGGWLNEGLSHIAEELLYYRVARLVPRQNIDVRDSVNRRRRSTRSTTTRATTSAGSRSSSANRRRRRCMPTTIRWRRAARRGTCSAISPIIAARRTATRGCGS